MKFTENEKGIGLLDTVLYNKKEETVVGYTQSGDPIITKDHGWVKEADSDNSFFHPSIKNGHKCWIVSIKSIDLVKKHNGAGNYEIF